MKGQLEFAGCEGRARDKPEREVEDGGEGVPPSPPGDFLGDPLSLRRLSLPFPGANSPAFRPEMRRRDKAG